MYVISLSNISIKTNFNQIASVELKCVQYSEGDYILCMMSRYFFRPFTNVRLLCFVSHTNGMMSCQSSQGFQSGPVPGTFTRLRSCIVPAEITEPPKN